MGINPYKPFSTLVGEVAAQNVWIDQNFFAVVSCKLQNEGILLSIRLFAMLHLQSIFYHENKGELQITL
ncbi:MAG: hypothetical protein AYK18_17650 [Theionarchaea archaeon DG-70]|nr:MAG: hypothetical protein AYK18_17650 [Theionarchaea archaeon DG-70]